MFAAGGTSAANPAAPTGTEMWQQIEEQLAWWVKAGAVTPRFTLDRQRGPRVILAGRGLWGAVARQLIFAVARVQGLQICHACGEAYTPKRKPRAGERTWCRKDACRQEAKRQAQRDYRARRPKK